LASDASSSATVAVGQQDAPDLGAGGRVGGLQAMGLAPGGERVGGAVHALLEEARDLGLDGIVARVFLVLAEQQAELRQGFGLAARPFVDAEGSAERGGIAARLVEHALDQLKSGVRLAQLFRGDVGGAQQE
jgi:hypothetical protein